MTKQIKAPKSLTVQGTVVTATLLATYSKRMGSIDSLISVWANAATLQVALHGNRNWLDTLFAQPTLVLKSGELSKAGKDVLAYIKAHYPRTTWDKVANKVAFEKMAEDSIQAKNFVAVGHTAPDADKGVFELRNKFYMPHGDFALTFDEFKNVKRAAKDIEPKEVSMTAKAFVKQAEKALECFKDKRFVGTPDELLSASLRAKELYLALDAEFNAASAKAAEADPVGVEHDDKMAAQLLASGQKGKAVRAGNKVEAAK